MIQISVRMCLDFICTFDTECHWDEVCNNRKCVKDTSLAWKCEPGIVDSPEMACKKVPKPSHGK